MPCLARPPSVQQAGWRAAWWLGPPFASAGAYRFCVCRLECNFQGVRGRPGAKVVVARNESKPPAPRTLGFE